jgi:hypothetical protein
MPDHGCCSSQENLRGQNNFPYVQRLSPASIAPVGRDHLDVVFLAECAVEQVRVVGFIADEVGRELIKKASGKNLLNKLALRWRSALHRYGERKTIFSGDSDDLCALAAPGGTDSKPPFLALAKVASTKFSSRFSRPLLCNRRASSLTASSSLPLRIHCWNLR